MGIKQRLKDLASDAARYGRNALIGWGDSIKDDPVYHLFSLAAGLAVGAGIWMAL